LASIACFIGVLNLRRSMTHRATLSMRAIPCADDFRLSGTLTTLEVAAGALIRSRKLKNVAYGPEQEAEERNVRVPQPPLHVQAV
jgi:hypothetical protein